ncbi:hypothetical protein D3C73_1597140 [compost metagenome]
MRADNLAHSKNIGMVLLGLPDQIVDQGLNILIEFLLNLMQTGRGIGGLRAVKVLVQIPFEVNVIG